MKPLLLVLFVIATTVATISQPKRARGPIEAQSANRQREGNASIVEVSGSADFSIPDNTISPNGEYGVSILTYKNDDRLTTDRVNRVIDLSTSRVLGAIQQNFAAFDRRLNHHGMAEAEWSEDSSLLLWKIDGKWFYDSHVLIKLAKDNVEWQRDLMKLSQKEILARTRKASPQQYAKAKKANVGSGEAYPEGFSVQVEAVGAVALPLKVRVALTSNPKSMPDHPALDSHMFATLEETGNYRVTGFHLGAADWSPFGS